MYNKNKDTFLRLIMLCNNLCYNFKSFIMYTYIMRTNTNIVCTHIIILHKNGKATN